MTAWLSEALTGPRVVVRDTTAGDLPALGALALDPVVRRHIGVRPLPADAALGWGKFATFEQYGLPQRQYEFRL
jgi:hypothetical protein